MASKQSRPWKIYALALAPALLFAAAFWLALLPWIASDFQEQQARNVAASKASQLDNSILQLSTQLDGMARLPAVRKALREQDDGLIAELGRDLSLSFADLDRLALVPLGELGIASLGQYDQVARSNIEKDILRRAANREEMMADTYNVEGKQVLGIARPVSTGTQSIGAMLLTVEEDWLASQLFGAARNESTGISLLYQLGDSAPKDIVSNNRHPDGHAAISALESNPNFKVRVTLPPTAAGQTAALATIGLLVVLGALVIVAVSLQQRSQDQALGDDIILLRQRISGQKNETDNAFNHPEFEALADDLADISPARQQSTPKDPDLAVEEGDGDIGDWVNPQVAGEIVVEDLDDDEADTLADAAPAIPAHIFRAYDIRANADRDLNDALVEQIGQAIGSEARDSGCERLVLGRDARLSSDRLREALLAGILRSGCAVIDIDVVTTPVLYYAAHELDTRAGVMITGSHHGAETNGFKIMLDGQILADQQITALAERIREQRYHTGDGLLTQQDPVDDYIDRITDDVVVAAPLKIVLDCANGAASEVAPILFAALGCETQPLYAELDGSFPNHAPDPSKAENLQALIDEVQATGADLGLAFDGDADRVAAVSASGKIVAADQLLMLFAQDVVTRNPGADIVYDIKCSRHLNQVIANHGGRPVMWKSGHSMVKQKMRETGALLGGEFTGHFCFLERWYGFDDGLYSGARLIELLTLEGKTLDEAVAELPVSENTPELFVDVGEGDKFELLGEILRNADFGDGKGTELDGIRVDYPAGWGLLRASNTENKLTLRFEANNSTELERIQGVFRQAIQNGAPELQVTW